MVDHITVERLMVAAGDVAGFESDVVATVAAARSHSSVLNVVARRTDAGSTILPAPTAAVHEYVCFSAGDASDDGQAWSDATGTGSLIAPVQSESYQRSDIIGWVSRESKWVGEEIYRLAFHRFRVDGARAEEFETEAARQIAIVAEQEPGTVLYGFFKRSGAASLLSTPAQGIAEYLHFMAYDSEESQQFHRALETRSDGWAWGAVFPTFLKAPLENESFFGPAIVNGFSRLSL